MTAYVVVKTTAATAADANHIADALLDAHLAACVQFMPITSAYVWQGRRERSAEVLLLIKARAVDYPAIEAAIRAVHTYAEPEITAFAIANGSPGYLAWIEAMTAGARPD